MRAANGSLPGAGLPGAFASNADLQRRVERAFDLAETTIEQIVACESGLDLSALEAPPDKVVAETAMLLRAVATLPDGTVRRCRVAALDRSSPFTRRARASPRALRCTRLSRGTMARPISS